MEDIPVPIPNTEVKLHSAESSWGIAPCEGRTLLYEKQEVRKKRGPKSKKPGDLQSIANLIRLFFLCMTVAFHDGNSRKQFGGKFD